MWVPMHTLKAILGNDMATTLCKNLGGVPIYVPHRANVEHELAKTIGLRGMDVLCVNYKGEYITVPNGSVQKEQVLEMLEQGMTKRSIALTCGVTERYVYMLAGLNRDTDYEGQLTLL